MRKFEDLMKEKLQGATSNYSKNIWENIKKEIPIAKKSNGRYYWMATFLFAFAMMILMVQQYPNWKVQQAQAENLTQLEPLDVSKFILSPADLASRQLHPTSYPKPTLKPTIQSSSKLMTTESAILAADVPTLANLYTQDETTGYQATDSQVASQQSKVITNFGSNPLVAKGQQQAENPIGEKAQLYSLANISAFNVGLNIPKYKIQERKRSRNNEVHCEVLKGSQSKFYVTARHVNSYTFNSLTIKNPSSDEYLSGRHGTESKKYSFSDELALGMEYRNGVFVELGLRYDQINQKFNFIDNNASGETTVIVIDTITYGGSTDLIVDTVTTNLTGQREIVNNNSFKKISVPLSVGYQFPLNKKVSIAARTGVVVNVWSKYNGKMFDENLDIVSISDRQSSSNPFFNKLVHSVTASAYLKYKMNKRMEFLVGLDGFKSLDSASYDSNPIDQKYSSLGIFIGTKYNL